MFRFGKKILIIIFALSLLALGSEIYLIIEYGFKSGKELIFQILLIISLIISNGYFYWLLFLKPKNDH